MAHMHKQFELLLLVLIVTNPPPGCPGHISNNSYILPEVQAAGVTTSYSDHNKPYNSKEGHWYTKAQQMWAYMSAVCGFHT